MARRDYDFERCQAYEVDGAIPMCSEYYPCSFCDGSGKVSDGYEHWICRACDGTGCGFESVCNCSEGD